MELADGLSVFVNLDISWRGSAYCVGVSLGVSVLLGSPCTSCVLTRETVFDGDSAWFEDVSGNENELSIRIVRAIENQVLCYMRDYQHLGQLKSIVESSRHFKSLAQSDQLTILAQFNDVNVS